MQVHRPPSRRTDEPGRRHRDHGGGPLSAPADPDRIKAEIEATRAQLSRTVDEIGARLDVKAQARERAYRARDTAVETFRESPPLVIGAAALAGLVVALVVWRRNRETTTRRKR